MAIYEPKGYLTLKERLQQVLPLGACFKLYHISTPPEKTEALSPPPRDLRPEKTYCESHFLSVSISPEDTEVLAFAIEVFIYSTSSSTTFFVSKADSTGYLGRLKLQKGISPIKEISGCFVSWLVEGRRRDGITSIVSLFARAQDQYLFPGSIDNGGKHVLDDRGLVRWWCRVLDPMVKEEPLSSTIGGYLLVPGLDKYETMGLLPSSRTKWIVGHPLENIFDKSLPPRCVIPHFPDDPKARFLDELDDEVASSKDGSWKSVKTMAQFWEMMAFRQECSAGRMVGFIWIVIKSHTSVKARQTKTQVETAARNGHQAMAADKSHRPDSLDLDMFLETPPSSQPALASSPPSASQSSQTKTSRTSESRPKRKLSGPIHPRAPKIKTTENTQRHTFPQPSSTPHYSWPFTSRGEVVLPEKDYKRIIELLLRLDFETLDLAISSSQRWINEVSRAWGIEITGTKVVEVKTNVSLAATPLNSGLVRKKRKVDVPEVAAQEVGTQGVAAREVANAERPKVNILTASMIKKKVRT